MSVGVTPQDLAGEQKKSFWARLGLLSQQVSGDQEESEDVRQLRRRQGGPDLLILTGGGAPVIRDHMDQPPWLKADEAPHNY